MILASLCFFTSNFSYFVGVFFICDNNFVLHTPAIDTISPMKLKLYTNVKSQGQGYTSAPLLNTRAPGIFISWSARIFVNKLGEAQTSF